MYGTIEAARDIKRQIDLGRLLREIERMMDCEEPLDGATVDYLAALSRSAGELRGAIEILARQTGVYDATETDLERVLRLLPLERHDMKYRRWHDGEIESRRGE